MYVKVSNYVLWTLGMFCGEHYPSFWLNNNLCLLWWMGEKCQFVFIFELLDTKWTQGLTIVKGYYMAILRLLKVSLGPNTD